MGERAMRKFVLMGFGAAALAWSSTAPAQSPPLNLYVRVDGGVSIPANKGSGESVDNSGLVGGGVGLKILPFLRTDVTVSYRTGYHDTTTDMSVPGTTVTAKADIKSLVGMVNAYYDFPTLAGFTPYVGGGVGAARNETSTINFAANGAAIGSQNGATRTDFAWQIGGGFAYALLPTIALDAGYHYLDAGHTQSGNTGVIGGVAVTGLAGTGRLKAHEITAGIRVGF
jgi:opacity protein-like surface antigen